MARFIFCMFCLGVMTACSSSVPAIEDADTLIKDCDVLLAGSQNRMLPADQWPASIQALHPVYVCVNDSDVMIATKAGNDGDATGYFVSHAPPFAGHRKLLPTAHADIYRFEWAQ